MGFMIVFPEMLAGDLLMLDAISFLGLPVILLTGSIDQGNLIVARRAVKTIPRRGEG